MPHSEQFPVLWGFCLYGLSAVFLIAGIFHFLQPRVFHRIMPPWISRWKVVVNYFVGIAEISGGLGLLFEATQGLAAIGLSLLLIAVFPANLYMVQNERASFGLPKWLLWSRLPLQGVLIAMALWVAWVHYLQ